MPRELPISSGTHGFPRQLRSSRSTNVKGEFGTFINDDLEPAIDSSRDTVKAHFIDPWRASNTDRSS